MLPIYNIDPSPEVEKAISDVLTIGEQFKENFNALTKGIYNNRGNLLWNLLLIVLVYLGAKLVLKSISTVTSRVMNQPKNNPSTPQGRRVHTLMTLLHSISRYAVFLIAGLMILGLLGMGKPINALLAAAGLGSLAIGFGAQNLVRDVVTGLFMIFENQFSVGDYIKTDEAEGTVEATAMRVTYLRSLKGDQIIVPNGSISRVVNYTRGGYVASVTISTNYESNTRKVIDFIDRAAKQYAILHQDLIEENEEPTVLGITALGVSSVDIGVVCRVKPMKQWEVERGIRLAIKEMFDANGINFPYQHIVTVPYEAPKDLVSYDDIFSVDLDSTDDGLY